MNPGLDICWGWGSDMSGKLGQRSSKPTELPARYVQDFLVGLDRRCRAARDQRELFQALLAEIGGADGLSFIELETVRRFAFLCRRIGHAEEADLRGERIDQAGLNDSTRSWLGLLRQFQAIKATRKPGGGDLAKALQAALEIEEGLE